MDIDISDILADVSRPKPGTGLSSYAQQPYDLISSANTDHQLLVRAWTSERTSPSLLPYPSTLISRTMTRIRDQIARIEDMTSGISTGGMDSYHSTSVNMGAAAAGAGPNQNTNLILSILQSDLSRTQFILRSYLRQRLHKITQYAVYWLKHHVPLLTVTHTTRTRPTTITMTDEPGSDYNNEYSSQTATDHGHHHHHNNKEDYQQETETQIRPLLSPAEISFLRNHQALLSEFYDSSFLAGFPPNLRRLDDSSGGINMVEGPDGSVAVVVRCLAEEWNNLDELDNDDNNNNDNLNADGVGSSGTAEGAKADVELRMRRGEVWVVRWKDIRSGIVNNDLELL